MRKKKRWIGPLVALGAVVAAAALAQQTSIDEGRLLLLQPNGAISIELDGNANGATFNDLILGRADIVGSLDADVDLEVIDPGSTLDDRDQSFIVNASAADLIVGSGSAAQPGEDGDLLLENGEGETLIDIDGATGNINQDVDNLAIANGNGAVKAWAKINADGTVFSCWKCNMAGTSRLSAGDYRVDFDLGNIAARPKFASPATHTTTLNSDFLATLNNESGDVSAVRVRTRNLSTVSLEDNPFTVFVF